MYFILGAANFGAAATIIYPVNIAAIIWPNRWMLTVAAMSWLIPVVALFFIASDLQS
jgi:hypothetical protein